MNVCKSYVVHHRTNFRTFSAHKVQFYDIPVRKTSHSFQLHTNILYLCMYMLFNNKHLNISCNGYTEIFTCVSTEVLKRKWDILIGSSFFPFCFPFIAYVTPRANLILCKWKPEYKLRTQLWE